MKYKDKITRKDGSWRNGRYATVITEPDSEGVILARFGRAGKYFEGKARNYIVIDDSNPNLTRKEFETLLTKAAQPLPKPEQPPAQETEQTLESQTSDDCSESHTH